MNNPKLVDVTPFEPLIIKTHYDGWKYNDVLKKSEEMIKDTSAGSFLEEGNAKSSAGSKIQPHMTKEFSEFYHWIKPICQHIVYKEWNFLKSYDFGIVNSWVNYHDEDGITAEHNHGTAIMVITAYLNLPEDGGFIEFKDPMEYPKGFFPKENNTYREYDWKPIKAKTGDVLMFPGWLRHRVQPNKSKERRWVLTTNLNYTK